MTTKLNNQSLAATANKNLKTKTKRAFALLMLALLAPAAAWAQSFSGGSGTETAPYLIATTDDMDALASQVNGGNSFSGTYFKMTADLDYTGKGYSIIGNYDNRFCGSFNGDDHTISNVTLSGDGEAKGIFGAIGSGGMVKNLALDQSSISGKSEIGGIAGFIENATISNCINHGSITSPSYPICAGLGGIVGYATNSSIIDCQNQGEVSRHDNAGCYATGGIVGRAENNCNISGCQNSAFIFGTENTGGIAGQANSGTIISHCKNTGTIEGQSRSGGIVGYADGANVSHCYNLARVTAYSGPAGGIVGRAGASSASNCLSLGIAQGYSNYNYASGGIVGWNYGDGNSYTNNYYRGNSYGISSYSTTMPVDVPGQAMFGYRITGVSPVEVSLPEGATVGVAYEGSVYAGEGESVSIGLSGPQGYNPSAGYNASAGSLTQSGTTWTLVMPQEDVTINPLAIAPHDIAAVNLSPNSADITWEGYCDSYALRYREIPTILKEGFEGGTMPDGWTIEGDNQDPARTWHVGIGDYNIGTGVHSGDYNALIKPKTNGQLTYLVTPALNLGEYASAELSFWYVNRKYGYNTDEFAVCYRNGNAGEWNELWSTDENHEGWTCQTVALTGLADNCQIGFRYTDRNANGVGLDDITIIAENTEWITVDETESPHTLTGLTTETTYEVQVKSNCEGYEDWSETLVFATLEACPVPFNVEASGIAATSAAVSWTGFSDSYDLSYRQAPGTLLNEGFEGGTMPQGWTIEGANQDPAKTWRVGVGDFDPATGTHSDNYNALITHNDYNQVTYLVTPALDLSEYGSVEISFWYVNRKWGGGIDELAVCYRIGNEGEWNQLWSTSENHQAWTSQTVALTGLASNYQIGFRFTDGYGYGVGLDDIALFDMTHSEWITLIETESPQTLIGLIPESEYEVKVQGVCGGEATEWSEAATFTTLAATTFTKAIAGYGQSSGGYYLIASPIAEPIIPSEGNGFLTNAYDLYHFNQSQDLEWRNYKEAPFVLENGKGYLYANQAGTTLTFIGAPYAGTEPVEVPLEYDATADFAGWNLVGNPFPVAAYANRSYYKMNAAGTAIEPVAVSSATPIEACTGVMVQAEASGESVTFSRNAQQSAGNGTIQIAVAQAGTRGNAVADKVIVSFNTEDRLEKFVLFDGDAKIYVQQGGKDYAVATVGGVGRDGVHTVSTTDEIPVNFKAAKNGTYTLTFDTQNLDLEYLHLIDNMTGADVDLLHPNAVIAGEDPQSPAPSYTFTARTTDYESRFKLVFVCGDANDDNDAPFAYISNGSIIVDGGPSTGSGTFTLQVVDVMGRVIVTKDVARNVSTNGMTPGVYVLRLIDGENVRTQKIVVE